MLQKNAYMFNCLWIYIVYIKIVKLYIFGKFFFFEGGKCQKSAFLGIKIFLQPTIQRKSMEDHIVI